ncbi:MAG: tRNA (adenosine(37)-N6)-threonylcarbamoyltransferase complex ATPase subunit type 1 TsaE [Gammaproteobacteria bacterium]|nr:tRNA (adenosine(37)-N6)-threonylcarbamoyltransferase complex ATPase subunit type 1 TsaE [Gammaproteobacteria bacterium]
MPADVAGWTILLAGELGAGKSTFARALIRAMGHEGPVPSPTYTLVEPYKLPGRTIYHIDLYRIASEDELRYLGWGELDDGLRLIEWPERVPSLLEQADLCLQFDYQDSGRRVEAAGVSGRGVELASRLGQKMS